MKRIEQEDEKKRMTEAAMLDVDRKALVSHADMQLWAASLDTMCPLPLPQ